MRVKLDAYIIKCKGLNELPCIRFQSVWVADRWINIRICFVSHIYVPYIGGAQIYLQNIAKALKRKNIEVSIVTGTLDKKQKKFIEDEEDGIKIIRVPEFHISRYQSRSNGKKLFKSLKKIFAKLNPDIVIFQNLFKIHPNFSLSAYLASLDYGIPSVCRIHTKVSNEKASLESFIVSQLGWDICIPVSKSISEDLLYNKKLAIKNLDTFFNGIDTKKFSPSQNKRLRKELGIKDDDILLLHVSRLVNYGDRKSCLEEKGVLNLLKSFSLVSELFPEMKLLIATPKIVGSKIVEKLNKEQMKIISDTACLNGIEDRVIVKSFQPDEMSYVYNSSDIVVLASEYEACSTVYLEAMSCEKPVIGTAVGGTPEIIDNGINGYIVEQDNPVELSKRIIWLAQNKEKRREFGKKGREKILNNFDINEIADQLIKVYSKLCKKIK